MNDADETLNDSADSSHADGAGSTREGTQGATTDSPAVTPDANSERSSDSPDANKATPKLTDVVKTAADTLGKDILEEGDAETDSSTAGKPEAGKAKPRTAAPKDERAAGATEANAQDAQFHTRADWKAAVEIGGDKIKPILRQILGREAQLSDRLQRADGEVKSLARIRSLTGNNEAGFKNLNAMLETFNSDPAGAIPMLEQLVNDARQRAGLVLQSEDLKREGDRINQQLKDNEIDQETAEAQKARLVEIEKARAGRRTAETRLRETNEERQQQAERGQQQQMVEALNTWENGIRTRFPDLGGLTDLNDPNHGESVIDQVFDLIASKVSLKPPATAAEYTSLAQQCLETVQKRIGKLLPPGRTLRPLTSHSSSATAKVAPKNFQEAEQQARRSLFGKGG